MTVAETERPAVFRAFVARASSGRNSIPRILVGLLIVIAIWFGGTLALMIGGAFVFALGWLPAEWVEGATGNPFADFVASRPGLVVAVMTLGAIWPGVWLAAHLAHKRRLRSFLGFADRIAWSDFLRAMVATLILGVLVSLVTLGLEPRAVRSSLSVPAWLAALAPLALILLVQTSAEEVLFRGYLLQSLAQRFRSPFVWGVLPALLFAIAHWSPAAQPWMNGAVVFSIFLFAIAAAWLVHATGNLGAAMGMHFANNLVAFLFLSSTGNAQAVSLWITPPVDDPGWAVADALIACGIQFAMTAAILALLVWRGSPLRLRPATDLPADGQVDADEAVVA